MILSCQNINKSFVTDDVLKDVSFHLEEREKAALIGPNGAGKSTLLKIIMQEMPADSGEVIVAKGKTLGYLAQHQEVSGDNTIYGELLSVKQYLLDMEEKIRTMEQQMKTLTGRELDELLASYSRLTHQFELEGGYACRSEVVGVLKGLGFEEADFHRPAAELSGGQKTRVSLGKLLLTSPDIILLDEPFSALDAKIRQQMREELKKIQSDLGITVIFVTHDQEEAMALSHRIVVMNKGKFDQVGTPGEIYDSPATLHVASFIGEMNFIRNGGSTIAVRPEDIVVNKGHGPMEAVVRTIMMLGHYVVLTVQRGNEIIKCYVDRELSDQLREGDLVNLTIGKHTVFSQAA